MSYVTEAQLIDRFGRQELIDLTDRERSGVLDSAVLDTAITDASSAIDTYLGGRHTLPLVVVPPVLVRVAGDLTRFLLYDDHAPEGVRQRYEDAVAWLKEVAAGRVQLGVDAQGAAPAHDEPGVSTGGRTFDAGSLADF